LTRRFARYSIWSRSADDTSIGAETHVLGYRIEDGELIIGRIDIGSRCFIGMRSCVGLGVKMSDEARLGDLSLLGDGIVMQPAESRHVSKYRPSFRSRPTY